MAEQLMTLAYDNGINLFDTAEVYAAGKYVSFRLGKVVQAAASLGRARDRSGSRQRGQGLPVPLNGCAGCTLLKGTWPSGGTGAEI